jgi:hypothetical protein
MKIALTIEFVNGDKVDVEAAFPDFVGFERTWSRSVARLDSDLRLTDLAWLGWSAMTRNKQTALKFDPDWVSTVVAVSPREDTDPGPLAQSQPTT